ncbi:MAG TPA: hypothetical protein DDZ51_10285 [Planctomycetaceae bacterium]|nr:hypothetical protein [Planctomycetaceae bacterium]
MSQSTGTPDLWTTRVSDYLDQLQSCVERLDESLDEMRMGTKRLEISQVDQSHQELAAALEDLESLIAAREELIRADDAPGPGMTIRDILATQDDEFSQSLVQRCSRISKDVDASRERAVALFVCQFHLADLSQSLLSIMRGTPGRQTTYNNASDVRRPTDVGGSILNKSA